jgi:hypothetical protein
VGTVRKFGHPTCSPKTTLTERDSTSDVFYATRGDYSSSRVEEILRAKYDSYQLHGDWTAVLGSQLRLEILVRKY